MPPWRGFRQVLAAGPWGKAVDKVSRKATKLILKTTNTSSQVLFVDFKDASASLVDKNDLPPKPINTLRIVAVSDTHGKHRFLPIPAEDCDILIHCGDILQRYGYVGDLGGGLPALYDFRSWLRSLKIRHKIFIGGNHDRLLEKLGDDKVREIFQKDDNDYYSIHYLRDSFVRLDGLTIYGSPWSPEGGTGNKAFQQGAKATTKVKQLLATTTTNNNNNVASPSIDILMTHAMCPSWEPILDSHNVQFWVHGHWHYAHGNPKLYQSGSNNNGCISVNVASNDMIYRPKNPPIVMDVRAPHQQQ